jgi:hypothetical protein
VAIPAKAAIRTSPLSDSLTSADNDELQRVPYLLLL